MPVVREVMLQLREEAESRGQPGVLYLRVFDQTNRCGGGWHELRGEDAEGNVRFAFRDPRPFLVMEEFDSTLEDLSSDYVIVEDERAAHG